MKKIALFLAVFLSAVFFAYAVAADNSPFPTGPAPIQTYHSVADNTKPTIAQPVIVAAPVSQPFVQTPPQTNYLNSAGIDTSENAELSRITQDNLAFEQQARARIENLIQSNQAIAVAIQSIDQQIAQLQQQMKTVAPHPQWINKINHDDWLLYFNMIIAAIFLIGVGLMLGRRFQNYAIFSGQSYIGRAQAGMQEDDTKSEYDFMGSKEAMPAQLDLARSYITMGEYDQATQILKMIIDKGDQQQRVDAKLLMEKLAS